MPLISPQGLWNEKIMAMPESPHSSLGLYFSIPFCRAKCTYCNFASGVYPAADHARYVDRLTADLASAPAWTKSMQVDLPRKVDTIYFGGGTPVLLAPELFLRIFRAIRENFAVDSNAEITVECAPGQLEDKTLEAMIASGVNRVSLGVQSFVDKEAKISGRFHTRSHVLDDLRRLRSAGITNLSLDLLAGLPEQTRSSWRESLSELLATGVPHASVYMLEIDEDSTLGKELLAGGTRFSAGLVPSDDSIAAMYEEAVEVFAGAGLKQYEISNFAQSNRQSIHNLRYWQRRPYLGLGLDASSMLRADDNTVLRTTTTDDLQEYLGKDDARKTTRNGSGLRAGAQSKSAGGTLASVETAWLSPTQQLEEAWFLGLRRNAGVEVGALKKEFGAKAVAPAIAVAERLTGDGLIEFHGPTRTGSFCLTDRGRLLSNEVFAEFLGLGHAVERHSLAAH